MENENPKGLAPNIKGHIFQQPGDKMNAPEYEDELIETRKNESQRLVSRVVLYTALVLVVIFLIYLFFIRVRTIQVSLDNIGSEIKIPSTVETAKLIKSGATYTLKKKEALKDKEYYVDYAEDYWFSSIPSPKDACSRVLDIVPSNEKDAVRRMKNIERGQWEIKTDEDKKQAERIMNDTNRLNEILKTAYLLPSNDFIRDDSRKIRDGDTIIVSGINFEITEPKDQAGSGRDVFMYVTKLEIK
jgi:hypothetical protein